MWKTTNPGQLSDALQRRLMKKLSLIIKWPHRIRAMNVYKRTSLTNWSKTTAQRRLSWFGHLARVLDETFAKKALLCVLNPTDFPIGKAKTTCISNIKIKQITTQPKNCKLFYGLKESTKSKTMEKVDMKVCNAKLVMSVYVIVVVAYSNSSSCIRSIKRNCAQIEASSRLERRNK